MGRCNYSGALVGSDNMILFTERSTYINVLIARFSPRLSTEYLGKIRRISDVWEMQFSGRNWTYYTDLLNGSEKRQIIGMLDKLNGNVSDDPTEELPDLRQRWNQIIGT